MMSGAERPGPPLQARHEHQCVIICSSSCNGYFHDELWPYLRELYTMFQKDHMNMLPDMNRYGEYFAANEEYVRKYRFGYAFHPFHDFSIMSCGHIAEKRRRKSGSCQNRPPSGTGGGLLGGYAGGLINEKICEKTVEKLFIGLMGLIILINIYNILSGLRIC